MNVAMMTRMAPEAMPTRLEIVSILDLGVIKMARSLPAKVISDRATHEPTSSNGSHGISSVDGANGLETLLDKVNIKSSLYQSAEQKRTGLSK